MSKHKCPSCGTNTALHNRADIRWCPIAADWIVIHVESGVDCDDCGWSGDISLTEVTDTDNSN